MTREIIETQVIAPIETTWGTPSALLIPAEGDSSCVLELWAQHKGIPVQRVACDWTKHGARASVLRNARIQKEATHLVLLQGPRSNALTQLARSLHRRGRPVVLGERPGQIVSPPDLLAMKPTPPVENGQA